MDMKLFIEKIEDKISGLTEAEIAYWRKKYDEDLDIYNLPENVELEVHNSLKTDYVVGNVVEVNEKIKVKYNETSNQLLKSSYTHEKYEISRRMVLAA